MDDKQAQLEWESRAGRWAAAAAYLAAAMIIASTVYSVRALPRSSSNTSRQLLDLHNHHSQEIIAAALSSIGLLLLIPVLLYLYRCTRFRRPALPWVAKWFAIAGPLLVAALQMGLAFKQLSIADEFARGAIHTNKRADELIRSGTEALSGAFFGARVVLGFGFGLISLNAMRAGLLSRFIGILGVILGALFALPILPAPPLQVFWLAALGFLFSGRWPGYGRGPAWESGEEIPWPSAAERAGLVNGGDGDEKQEPEPEPAAAATPSAERNAGARSRKRKKRR